MNDSQASIKNNSLLLRFYAKYHFFMLYKQQRIKYKITFSSNKQTILEVLSKISSEPHASRIKNFKSNQLSATTYLHLLAPILKYFGFH